MPTDTTLTKLRILRRRAEAEFEAARKRFIEADFAYMTRMRELNLCPACEKHEDLCQCVTMATSSPNSSETIEENFVF